MEKKEFEPIILNKPDPDKQKSAKGVLNINQEILQPNFTYLLVGKPGSGKSFILREIILNKDMYNKKFGLVLFITPSKFEDPEIQLGPDNHSLTLNTAWIYSRLYRYRDFINNKYKDEETQPCKNILIIFDDVIGDLKQNERNPDLISLFYNRRHLLGDKFMISIVVTTQKYILCPPKIRSVLTGVMAFVLMRMDWLKLQEECIYDSLDKRVIDRFYRSLLNEPYAFLYIRLDNGKVFYKFEKCLNDV
ncbi:MAG TPA: ATPase/DNA packaging protein [Saprospiraceae bacterium]|nr:ATPase/DNA packaging protein [Saprospiraceae bacterium]